MKTHFHIIALFAIGILTLLSACIPAETTVMITKPAEGAKVDQFSTIGGTSQALPADSAIWVIIYLPQIGRYFPQNAPADVQANGEWASPVYIGQEGDSGLLADVIVVLADKTAQSAFSAYLTDAKDKNDYPGLETLPNGAVIYDRISVARR